MDYRFSMADVDTTIPGGTGILLLHPSIGETDRIDTDFLRSDTDRFLVISTRTTAREVEQKLEYYDLDPEKADILDTVSVDRGYTRRAADRYHYVAAPDDLDGIVSRTERFLSESTGRRRISVDSLTEMAYYADEERVYESTADLLQLLERHDAVGLFHLSKEVHDAETIDRFRRLFDGVIDLDEDGSVTVSLN